MKKDDFKGVLTVELEKTPDILKEIAPHKDKRIVVGFALETEDGFKNAQKKLREKNLDLIILNHPAPDDEIGIGKEMIQGTIFYANGEMEELPVLSKSQMAAQILDRIRRLLPLNPSENAYAHR